MVVLSRPAEYHLSTSISSPMASPKAQSKIQTINEPENGSGGSSRMSSRADAVRLRNAGGLKSNGQVARNRDVNESGCVTG